MGGVAQRKEFLQQLTAYHLTQAVSVSACSMSKGFVVEMPSFLRDGWDKESGLKEPEEGATKDGAGCALFESATCCHCRVCNNSTAKKVAWWREGQCAGRTARSRQGLKCRGD